MENNNALQKEWIENIKSNALVYNDYKNGHQVLKTIIDNLSDCDEFAFTVAFINDSGLVKLKQVLQDLSYRNIKGRIITTNYLFFSDPKSLRELMKMANIEIKMYYLDPKDKTIPGFHTKGYIFRKGKEYDIVVGSSNLTASALTVNKEWNIEIEGDDKAYAVKKILDEFNSMWNGDNVLPMSEIIDTYEQQYKDNHTANPDSADSVPLPRTLTPNAMQTAFITRLNDLIDKGETRGLLISATGTGKTFASAFGMKGITKFNVKKLLFITHREIILKQAKKTFEIVYDNSIKTALFTGKHKDIEGSDFVFGSFNLLIKDTYLNQFRPDEFDAVIIDEVHKVGNNKYQKIIDYFKPKFLLGMSATPDRTDSYDIYQLFHHNIVYEVRLMGALESNMLTPFNYFGITDLTVDNKVVDDDSELLYLTADERVNNILKQAEYYSFSGNRLKGLVFVSKVEEGRTLSAMFNARGYKTVFLSGSDAQDYREECIQKLEEDDPQKEQLDYIFTVDIFNEGVDIPSVNQIVLLRPTMSSIIFIQQLGRGLRLYKGKEYVTILDFIGNYKNNYFIAKALCQGTKTKGSIARAVHEILPGSSSVSFDRVSKEKIYQSIDHSNINSKISISKTYKDVRNMLGRIPTLIEFEQYGDEQSSRVFLDVAVFPSYYDFLAGRESSYENKLNEEEALLIRYISRYFSDGKRLLEIVKLKALLIGGVLPVDTFHPSEEDESIVALFNGSFNKKYPMFKGSVSLISMKDNKYVISDSLMGALKNPVFKDMLDQLFDYAEYANDKYFRGQDNLVLFEKYTRTDFFRITNCKQDDFAIVYGYRLIKERNILPLFVNYHKKMDAKDSMNYEDHFVDEDSFVWVSRHDRTLDSKEIKEILDAIKHDCRILLFVAKANSNIIKDDDSCFYYLGECNLVDKRNTKMQNGHDAVEFLLWLEKTVRKDVYDYLLADI